MSKPRRKRRPWTEEHDKLLRKFHAERKDDGAIAYIMDRERRSIWEHRNRLKLAPWPQQHPRGHRHSPEVVERMAQWNRERWQDPAYREKHLPRVSRLRAEALAKNPFRQHARGTPEYKHYWKLIRNLGRQRAKQEMGYV